MWTDQPNFFVDDISFSTPTTYRTSKRTKNNYPGSTMSEAGAYGDNPWPKDGMTSFYEANLFFGETINDLDVDWASGSEECAGVQGEQWEEQWNIINPQP